MLNCDKKCVNIIYTFIVWYNINTAYASDVNIELAGT